MSIDTLETAWGELLRRFGDLVVARHLPPAERTERLGTTVRRYRSARRSLPALHAAATPVDSEERRGLEIVVGVLGWLDEMEPTPATGGEAGSATGHAPPVDPEVAALRRRVLRRYGAAAAAIDIGGGEAIGRLEVFARLAREEDPDRRRRSFEAMAPVWRAVDGDGDEASPYRTLVRSSAARWTREGSPIEANAAALGIEPGGLEPMLRRILAAWRLVVGPDPVEPWDYRFLCGAAARRLDPLVPVGRLCELNDTYLASLGADAAALGIRYDLQPRPGRPVIPVAFTIGLGPDAPGSAGASGGPGPHEGPPRMRPPYVFATYTAGGLGDLGELLHESGHAVHLAGVRQRPAFAEYPPEATAFLEATADVLGHDVDEPAWQRRWLGKAATPREAALHRYGSVMLDVCWALFEIELHRHPDRRANDVWTEITADGLGIVPHPEWSWWAVRGQLIDAPGYLADYAMSAIVASAVRGRLRELLGDWTSGDRRWYPMLIDALFAPGSSLPPADLLRAFLGGPVTEAALLEDLGRA